MDNRTEIFTILANVAATYICSDDTTPESCGVLGSATKSVLMDHYGDEWCEEYEEEYIAIASGVVALCVDASLKEETDEDS